MPSRLSLWVGAAAWLLFSHPVWAGDRERYFYSDIFTPFFSAAPTADGKRLYKPRRQGSASGQQFVEPKPGGTTRLFVVGGSIANVFLSVRREPETRLDRVLERAFPGRRFEVIDCGMPGYDSYRESLVLEQVLARRPDAVILLTGNNEAYGEGEVNWLLRGTFRSLSRWAAFRAARGAFIKRFISGRPRMPDSSQTARERWLASFAGNLTGMARAAKSAGIPLVLCTLPVNSQDIPPEDEWSLPMGDRRFLEAFEALVRGDYPAARDRFRVIVQAAPQQPWGRYYLAKSWEALGRFAEARAAYAAALDRDRLTRCSPSANAVIRRIAAQEGAGLADLEGAFLSAAPHGLLGRAMFVDDVHWHLEYNRLADRAMLASLLSLAQMGWPGLGPRSGWDPGSLAAAERFCAADRVRIDGELRRQIADKRLLYAVSAVLDLPAGPLPGRGPRRFSERALAFLDMLLSDDRSLVLGLGGREDWLRDRLQHDFLDADRRQTLEARWPAVLMHAGEACRRRRLYREAVAFFDQALALRPTAKVARLYRAAAQLALHRKRLARPDLAALIDGQREFPEADYFRDLADSPGP